MVQRWQRGRRHRDGLSFQKRSRQLPQQKPLVAEPARLVPECRC